MSLMIEGMPLWLAETNAWLVAPSGPGGECVLIDAPPDPAAILARLQHHGLRLVALLSTHGHVDHVGGIGSVAPAQDPEVAAPLHHDHPHNRPAPVSALGGCPRHPARGGPPTR